MSNYIIIFVILSSIISIIYGSSIASTLNNTETSEDDKFATIKQHNIIAVIIFSLLLLAFIVLVILQKMKKITGEYNYMTLSVMFLFLVLMVSISAYIISIGSSDKNAKDKIQIYSSIYISLISLGCSFLTFSLSTFLYDKKTLELTKKIKDVVRNKDNVELSDTVSDTVSADI